MARKILQCTIKTIDDKGHVKFWNESQVTIKFNEDTPKPQPKVTESPIKKKIKKIIPKKKN